MKKRLHLLAALVAVALLAGAQEAAAPQAPPPTPAQLDRAIEDFARQIPAGITADRYAAFAVAMPADAAEYQALNKHALLVVAALSKDSSELPLKRVYLEQEKRTTELSPFAVVRSEVPADSPAGKLMGTHRVDAYYLIPLSAWRQPGTLLADFAAHRSEFIVGRFPLPIKEEFIRDDAKPEPARRHKVPPEAILQILGRASVGRAPARIHIEHLETQPVHTVRPRYPSLAKDNRIGGTVVLSVVIGTDGAMKEAEVLSGDRTLAEAAMGAVMQWRYRPFLLNGQGIEVETQIEMTFEMR